MAKVLEVQAVPGCHFHGRDSGHGDRDCPATDWAPVLGGFAQWCQCPAEDTVLYGRGVVEGVNSRQRFFVHPDGHGWWDPACKGLVQSG